MLWWTAFGSWLLKALPSLGGFIGMVWKNAPNPVATEAEKAGAATQAQADTAKALDTQEAISQAAVQSSPQTKDQIVDELSKGTF